MKCAKGLPDFICGLWQRMWHECVCATVGPARDVSTTWNLTQNASITIFHGNCVAVICVISFPFCGFAVMEEIVERDLRIAHNCMCVWADVARRHLQFNSVLCSWFFFFDLSFSYFSGIFAFIRIYLQSQKALSGHSPYMRDGGLAAHTVFHKHSATKTCSTIHWWRRITLP